MPEEERVLTQEEITQLLLERSREVTTQLTVAIYNAWKSSTSIYKKMLCDVVVQKIEQNPRAQENIITCAVLGMLQTELEIYIDKVLKGEDSKKW